MRLFLDSCLESFAFYLLIVIYCPRFVKFKKKEKKSRIIKFLASLFVNINDSRSLLALMHFIAYW